MSYLCGVEGILESFILRELSVVVQTVFRLFCVTVLWFWFSGAVGFYRLLTKPKPYTSNSQTLNPRGGPTSPQSLAPRHPGTMSPKLRRNRKPTAPYSLGFLGV